MSTSRPGRSGSDPAQASAAAAARDPLASPTAATRTTRPLIVRPASRSCCLSRPGDRRPPRAATAAPAEPSPLPRAPRPRPCLGPRWQRPFSRALCPSPGGKRERSGLGRTVGQGQRVAGEQKLQGDRPGKQQQRNRRQQLHRRLAALASHRPARSPSRPSGGAAPAAGAGLPPARDPVRHRSPARPRAATAAAPGAPPPSRPRPPAPPWRPRAPPRPADQSACPASASCAATRTASSRKGTAAINSTEAVPSSLWPALLTIRGGTRATVAGDERARGALTHTNQSPQPARQNLSRCWRRSRSARSPPPRRRAG